MKQIALFALACASLFGALQVNAQEVTYVEDCSQGLLINRMQDNWFITAQGGANWFHSNYDTEAAMKNRIGASVGIFVGKWFTPVWGFRLGASAHILRGATTIHGAFRDQKYGQIEGKNGYYPEKIMQIGPEIDLMLSLTNWWCGYNPNRVYNGVVHIGGGGYWNASHSYFNDGKWKWINAHNRTLFANLGYTNNFAVSKQVDIFLDIQYTVEDFSTLDRTYSVDGTKDMTGFLQVSAGFTYKFKKRDWSCPITAVCPTWKYTDAEGDALVAKLADANNKISDLQRQLDDCLNRPQKEADCVNALATVYYPINVSTLSSREVTLVQSMAKVMKENPGKKYVLTGWADNYTGNDKINTRLRNERVNGVYDCLVKAGVPEKQLEKRIDNKNLTDYGIKGAQFDRAVTVWEAK